MIIEREGDLFLQTDLDALAHGVNCRGVMGAGIAVGFKVLDRPMFEAYREICYAGELRPGNIFPWKTDSGIVVYNIASQDKPGREARYFALTLGLQRAVEHAEKVGVRSIGMPRIGCGIGGLEWEKVKDLMNDISEETSVKLVVVTPPRKGQRAA
jgi:O-acetyl-ADP-ribose deacetylase (regulator of RNase III)